MNKKGRAFDWALPLYFWFFSNLSACFVAGHSNPCHLDSSNPGILEPYEITFAQLEMTHLFYPNELQLIGR
jgi:hypothetical protein